MTKTWQKNIVMVARVKQFIEWFNELDDVAMEKLLALIDEYIENIEKMENRG